MRTRKTPSGVSARLASFIVLAACSLTWLPTVQAQAAPETALRTSTDHGVTLKATPSRWSAEQREWSFSIVLDTHSQALDDDLAKSAVLVVDGRELAPLGWTGAAPGGHHREGQLRFTMPGQLPAAVELRIQRPQEAAPRVLRWDAGALK